MRRSSLVLSAAVVAFAVIVWRQRAARDAWRERISVTTERIATARAQAATAAERARKAAALSEMSPPANGAREAAPSKTASDAAAAAERAQANKARADRQFRLNALNGYEAGFVALHLPPEIEARAKDRIVAHWQAMADARAGTRSLEEMLAAHETFRRAMDDELGALLGKDTWEQLQAYDAEEHLDWTVGTDLWDAGVPLRAEQLHALALATVRTGFEEPRSMFEPRPADVPDALTGLRPQDEALLAASRVFLTAAQQEALRQNLVDDNRYTAAMRDFSAKQRKLWESAKAAASAGKQSGANGP